MFMNAASPNFGKTIPIFSLSLPSLPMTFIYRTRLVPYISLSPSISLFPFLPFLPHLHYSTRHQTRQGTCALPTWLSATGGLTAVEWLFKCGCAYLLLTWHVQTGRYYRQLPKSRARGKHWWAKEQKVKVRWPGWVGGKPGIKAAVKSFGISLGDLRFATCTCQVEWNVHEPRCILGKGGVEEEDVGFVSEDGC